MKIASASPALAAGRINRQSEAKARLTGGRCTDLLIRAFMLLMLCAGAAATVLADDVDRVRQLRSTDSILPLSKILANVERGYPGALLDVELEDEKGVIFYEIEWLGSDRTIRTIKVDARSGKIISPERH